MKYRKKIQKEIRSVFIAFMTLGVFTLGFVSYGAYQIHVMHGVTNEILNHPFQVSNSSLKVEAGVLKIHDTLNHLVLPLPQQELSLVVENINEQEQYIYEDLRLMKEKIRADDGKKLQEESEQLFREWKPLRDEIIALVKNNDIPNASQKIHQDMEYVIQLQLSLQKIYKHAQKRAVHFKSQSNTIYKDVSLIYFLSAGILLLLFIFITYYTVQRISNYFYKNEHLRGVLSVIRDINQLIVREKDKQKLIQESCDILASKHVFADAWIVLMDSANCIEHIAGTDNNQDFSLFKKKIASGWTPFCMAKTVENNNTFSFIDKNKEHCLSCPLMDVYSGESALNMALKYNEKVFGYLTISLNESYVNYNNELPLLEEVAGDIAYALNNIDVEKSVIDLKELYGNVINSIENIIFVKDTNFTYIACNNAFEKLIGKSKDEIIGKSDYDIVGKDVADFFREHDIKMLEKKKAKSNFEWVTYPDGKRVYLLTVKSPLQNSEGAIIGLVGNSVDVTKQKEVEQSLLESEERFKLLMQESPSVIEVYDLDGFQVDVNYAYELLWGFPATLTLNKFNLFKSEEVAKRGLLEYVKRAYAGESVTVPLYQYDSTGATEAQGQGRVRILNTKIYPLKDASSVIKNIVITHEDVTDKENTRLLLEQKKSELEAIILEAPSPIILHTEDGNIIMLNQAWIDASGYTLEETPTIYTLVDKFYDDIEMRKFALKHIESLYHITSKVDEGEFTFLNKKREKVTWKFISAPLGMIDGKYTIISSAMDITELKKKDELMITQSRHAAMGEMISMIAHQWRQPLSVISMVANNILLDIALEELNPKEVEKYSRNIIEQTEHLSKTIDDFRNFFKQDKNVLKVQLEVIINETYAILKESLVNNNIRFQIFNHSELEVETYPRELMQVFVNIINNAKDALVSKKVKNAFIEVTIYEDEDYINAKICDNGGGIAEEILTRIFEPYFTTKDEKNGTGLGLYMSKMIVQEHLHGAIEVTNQDEGVCFIVKLLKRGNLKNGE